jgi:hypothetical protein
MMQRLVDLRLDSVDFHWVIACPQTPLSLEHNSVAVTAKDEPFEEGWILDPWRKGGELYWGPVKEDRYRWQEMSLDADQPFDERYPCDPASR